MASYEIKFPVKVSEVLDSITKIENVLVALGTITGLLVMQYVLKMRRIGKRIKGKQDKCLHSFQKLQEDLNENGISKKKQQAILDLEFKALQAKLQKNELSAAEVLTAYQQKALQVNKNLNCIVEPIQEAMLMATACDQANGNQPLRGIPVSIKENYYIKGYESTGGMSTMLNKPAREDGVLIKVLKHQGAVPFVRTNIPQSMMTFECSNPIFGTTVNPNNLKRGPGGSSGGEGALIGGEGSILGWGSDIGGSLRIPSNACGISCLKPTFGRLSLKTCEELSEGQRLIIPTCGPMARDVDTLVEAMKAVLCPYHFELDPEVPPIPFRSEIYESKKPLRIGYYNNDGNVKCIPGVERAVDEARVALQKMGHTTMDTYMSTYGKTQIFMELDIIQTLVPFKVPKVEHMFGHLFTKICFGDGGDWLLDLSKDDKVDPANKLIILTYKLPRLLQRLLSYPLSFFSKEKIPGMVLRSMQGVNSVKEWWALAAELEKYKAEFLSAWKASKLDAMVCPTMPYAAVPTGCVKYLIGGVTYSTLYNVLNYPSGCVPVTKVTAIDQAKMKDYPTNTATQQFIKKFYSYDSAGLPVTVQCVALPFQEEQTLRVMKDLETGLKKK